MSLLLVVAIGCDFKLLCASNTNFNLVWILPPFYILVFPGGAAAPPDPPATRGAAAPRTPLRLWGVRGAAAPRVRGGVRGGRSEIEERDDV